MNYETLEQAQAAIDGHVKTLAANVKEICELKVRNSTLELAQTACIGERDEWKDKSERLEAQCEVMRGALVGVQKYFNSPLNPENYMVVLNDIKQALSTAGTDLLAQLERYKVNAALSACAEALLKEAVGLLTIASPPDSSRHAYNTCLDWIHRRDAFLAEQKP